MPQIVLSTDYKPCWVGFELYPDEIYYSMDKVNYKVPSKDIELEPSSDDLIRDIQNYLGITITENSPVFKEVCLMLRINQYTNSHCVYFSNHKAKYGVSRYTGSRELKNS